jgi:hypothetical protein
VTVPISLIFRIQAAFRCRIETRRLSDDLRDTVPPDSYWGGYPNKRSLEFPILILPPLKLMDLEEASVLANADVQEKLYWRDCIAPRLRRLEDWYNEFVLPLFERNLDRFRLRFDVSGIEAFREDEEKKGGHRAEKLRRAGMDDQRGQKAAVEAASG